MLPSLHSSTSDSRAPRASTAPARRPRALAAALPAVVVAALLAAALPVATVAPARAASAPASDAPLALRSQSEDLGPGISLRRDVTLERAGWFDDHVLSVDLSRPAVSTDLLTAGPGVSDRGPLSVAANARGAVAGTNADYFDIDGSGAPLAAEVQGSTLLKSAQIGGRTEVGVSTSGLASVVDAVLDSTVEIAGEPHRVLSLNSPNGQTPPDALIAFTSAWGTASRANGLPGATDTVEAVVQGGAVVDVHPGAGTGPIAADAFVLQGRGASAALLSSLAPGTPATLSYRLTDDLEKKMRFVVGGAQILVKDGVEQKQSDTSVAPRTVLGIKDGGRTLLLLTSDGRQNLVPGRTLEQSAKRMLALGATDAVNLDGGGSTTMVARAAGDAAAEVRNTPSDGAERADPNGVGVFVAPTGRGADSLVVRPDADPAALRAGTLKADAAFPGLRRTLTLAAVDANLTPVPVPTTPFWIAGIDRVQRTASGATVVPSTLSAGRTSTVTAIAGRARGTTQLRVLRPLTSLTTSSAKLALPGPGAATHLDVIGHDRYGYTAPVEFEDLALDYDRAVIRVERDRAGLAITPLTTGATLLRITAAGVTTTLPVTVGVTTSTVYAFDHPDETSRWAINGTATAEQRLSTENGKLRLDFSARRNQGISVADPAGIALPGSPLRVRVGFTSSRPMQFSSLRWTDAKGVAGGYLGAPIVAGAQLIDWVFPPSTAFPVRLTQFQAIETDTQKQGAGSIVFDSIQVDQAPALETPPLGPPTPDALVSPDGTAPSGPGTWSFATLSDVQFTAANPELAKVGVAALKRIARQHPDLVVLNGDITDLGAASDVALARKTLEEGGCDLVPVGAEPAKDSTPDGSGGRFPCYYVPGNHESYRSSGQGDLAPWTAEFGRPYRTFDHKGTRFVLLNSALGTLRGSSWEQLPMLRDALDSARSDASVKNVMVFAHHPVDDPAEAKTSQLGDRMEVALVERLLTDFRTSTGKGAAMVGSHAQIADVHRVEGVPYTVLPSSGKAPYGTPDRGGFTGYVDWTVDPRANADGQWLTADVRAFAQSVRLDATSGTVRPGATTTVSGSIVQPSGVSTGDRVVPLRYPMTLHWSGSSKLAIGSGDLARLKAIVQGRVAILDPTTGVVTGLRPGRVTVTETNESMRAYTGPSSLAPVSGSVQITVTR